jgi:hypothetical protein
VYYLPQLQNSRAHRQERIMSILSTGTASVGAISVEIRESDAGLKYNLLALQTREVSVSRVFGLRVGDELFKIREALLAAKSLLVVCDTYHPSDNTAVNAAKMSLARLLNDLEIY